ncbi:coiled coil domain containing protein 39 [Echinococcus multilocularis]|uniref:Coiled-coil domain-containing protein 39 n=1 Tax=Echinococcus multilocularis TaxID=6211 RepID=A0A068YEI1_ECHMU|nr:coiled coil domain containing protein 39 [Echinococcus multilocularis]
MEKLGREARNDVEERIDVLKLWEKTVIRTQNRGREIDALLQSVEALSHRIDAKSQERNERECGLKHAVKDTSEQNTRLEKFVKQLEFLKQKHSSLHVEIKDACSQLKVLRVITERSHISTNSLRSNIKEKRTIISLLTEKLTTTLEQIGELKGKAEEICTSKVSIDQLVIEAEHHLQEEEKNAIKFRKEIKNLCRSRFNILQERKIANEERLRIENLVRNCRNELEKLNNQIHIEEEKVMHQERTIYEQDFKIVQIENRLSKLQNETLSDETKDYQEGIQRLSTELERLSKVQRKLLTELEILQVESKQVERAFEELLSEKGTVDLIKENDTIYVEQAETSLKRCKNEYKTVLVDKTMLKLKMRRSNEKLQFYNEKVFDLEKDRLYMKNCEKERETDISIAIGMAVATLRLTNEENAKLKKEINCRRLQTSKLINRYEIESLKMARTSEGRVGNQPLHMIKVLQEMDGLKSHGDKLDAEIKQSEKELEALQNTLSLLKESNRICESSYLEAESDLVQERNILEQSRKELKSTVHRKKEQLLSTRTKVEELKLAMDAADQELIKAQFCGNELQTDTSKLEKAINILDQRILRATRCLTKSKSAALKHIRKVGDIKEMEIRADIELQLKRELNEKLVALTMSQLRSKDQKGVEVQARVYLAAADIITGPRSSWAPLRDTTRLSGTSSTGNPCSSAAATTPSPTSTRSSIPQQLSLPEGRTLLGESSSCRASTKSERPSKDSCG